LIYKKLRDTVKCLNFDAGTRLRLIYGLDKYPILIDLGKSLLIID